LRQIANEIGVAKTQIRKALINGGLVLRPSNRRPKGIKSQSATYHIGVAPYGYFIQHGRLIADSREQIVVQKIMKLWSEEKSLSDIARSLNSLKIKPRTAKAWDHSIIRSIVNRHQPKTSGGHYGTR
jgi:hypothetical protein